MLTRLFRSLRPLARKLRRRRRSLPAFRRGGRSPVAPRRLLAEPLEERTLLTTDLVSVAAFPLGTGNALTSSMSADGRYVAFASDASNWVAGDTNRARDVFRRDLQTGTTQRVSLDSAADQGNNWSDFPSISADGRYVTFVSHASNLVADDTNGVADVFVRDTQTNTTTRVSVDGNGNQANANSEHPSISADGRYIAFASYASNLVADDTNHAADVFVRDLQTNTITRVSVNSSGRQAKGSNERPSISADGRYVAFSSRAENLAPDDTNGVADVFVRDLQISITTCISVTSSGDQANGDSYRASITADGRFVAFLSNADNIIGGHDDGSADVFIRDQLAGITTRVNVNNSGGQSNGWAFDVSINGDGRYVAFSDTGTNLVPGDTNSAADVFVRDLRDGTTRRVSLDINGDPLAWSKFPSISADGRFVVFEGSGGSPGGAEPSQLSEVLVRDLASSSTVVVSVFYESSHATGDGVSQSPSISADGRFVAFASDARNLVEGDTNLSTDVFVRDMETGTTTRVSQDSNGNQGKYGSEYPSISADGRYVAFSSVNNLVADDSNEAADVFVRDIHTGTIVRVSVDSSGNQGNGMSLIPSISADGRYVAFMSSSSDLVPSDTNSAADVFVRDLRAGTTVRVSLDSEGNEGNDSSFGPSISADGRHVAFVSDASNLVGRDTNEAWDVFVRDLETNTTMRVSVSDAGEEGNRPYPSYNPSISADGRYVAFQSSASNLVDDDTNGVADVFVRDVHAGITTCISVTGSGILGDRDSRSPSISADGRFVTFHSSASDLVAGDTNKVRDVFVRDRQAKTMMRVSLDSIGNPSSNLDYFSYPGSFAPSISADGKYVAFASSASNLVEHDINGLTDVFRVSVPAATSITLTADTNSTSYGQSAHFTARVSGGGLAGTGGTVTFLRNGAPIGGPVPLDADGRATFSISTLSAKESPHTVTAVFNGTAEYSSSFATTTHTVSPAPLTVVAEVHMKFYDGEPFSGFDVHYVGLVNGEDAVSAGIAGSPGFGGTATTAIEPGTYTIIPTVSTLTADNYEFTAFVNGTLTIIAADFGDAPDSYRTLLARNGPRHAIGSGLHFGAGVDVDADGKPGVEAAEDASDDGVRFTSVLRQTRTATVRVNASQAGGKLDAFLDFNADGDFSYWTEKIFDNVPLAAGDNELQFVVPADAPSAITYARFRISSQGGLNSFGPAADGEVEDYRVAIGLAATKTLRADGRYQFDAYNVTPGGVVVFCYGRQLGPNPLPNFGVTLGLTDPVYLAQGIADPTGHARALLAIPAAVPEQPVYYQVFEQGPDPQASSVQPLTAAALEATPSGGDGEASGESSSAAAAAVVGDSRRDVNRDGRVTPLDVLLLINFLNQQAADRAWLDAAVFPPPSYDMNDDGDVSPLDVLSVINELNGVPAPAAEGEGQGGAGPHRSDGVPHGRRVGRERPSLPATPVPPRRAGLPVATTSPGYPRSTLADAASRDAVFTEPDWS